MLYTDNDYKVKDFESFIVISVVFISPNSRQVDALVNKYFAVRVLLEKM